MVNYSSDSLTPVFSALADPTRRAILERLAQRESSVTELAEPFDVSLPAISKQLRVLENAGLLTREKEGRVHRCRLAPEPLRSAADWIAYYQGFWEKQLNALAEFLNESVTQEKPWPKNQRTQRQHYKSKRSSRRRGRRFLTDPEKLTRWLCRASARHSTKLLELDVRAGGHYRLEVTTPEEGSRIVSGTYREVKIPERLVFTWQWEGDPDFGETLVTVDLHARGESTEMVLTHERFSSSEGRDSHATGWQGCFDRLTELLQS